MRRVVFIGNCQVQSLSQLYRRFADGPREEQIAYLPSYEDLTDDRAATHRDSGRHHRAAPGHGAAGGNRWDRQQRRTAFRAAARGRLPLAVRRPAASAQREAVVLAQRSLSTREMGDSYLNRLIDKGVHRPKPWTNTWPSTSTGLRNLDRFFELVMDRQRSRDAACGFQIADLIEEQLPRRADVPYPAPSEPSPHAQPSPRSSSSTWGWAQRDRPAARAGAGDTFPEVPIADPSCGGTAFRPEIRGRPDPLPDPRGRPFHLRRVRAALHAV